MAPGCNTGIFSTSHLLKIIFAFSFQEKIVYVIFSSDNGIQVRYKETVHYQTVIMTTEYIAQDIS